MWPLLFDLAVAVPPAAPPPAASSPAVSPAAPPPERAPAPPPAVPEWTREVVERVDLYGRFDGHVAASRDDVAVRNNGSRFGIRAEQALLYGISLFGHGEWRVNLGKGDTSYAISENPDTGLATLDSTTGQAFTTRLGYVGLRSPEYGALTLGKQWGVYYDVSEWTDRFVVFGTHGSSTFNAGTDGGQTGEGRANDAVAYRVRLGPLGVGVQAQLSDSTERVLDSLSGSLVFHFAEGVRVGVAYSHAFIELGPNVVGYDGGDAQAFTAGVTFESGAWTLSALDTWTRNHELVSTPSATVAYDTLGAELYLARRFREVLLLYGGFDFAIPRSLDSRYVDPDYGTRDLLGGARFAFDARASSFAYLELRTGRTRDTGGVQAEDLVMLGLRVQYSLRRGLGLEP
jgi:predicted porin